MAGRFWVFSVDDQPTSAIASVTNAGWCYPWLFQISIQVEVSCKKCAGICQKADDVAEDRARLFSIGRDDDNPADLARQRRVAS
jgi:hypothetical protein